MAVERRSKAVLHWQKFAHNISAYSRPNQRWVCGKQPQGCPCHIGPDEKGNCRATYECQPIKRNDRFYCTRSKQLGGQCDNGPLQDGRCCTAIEKCIPIQSVRSKRASLAYAAAILTLGMILFFMAGSMRSFFISPGPLATSHGSIAGDCKLCHSVENLVTGQLLETALHPFDGMTESHLCLDCHNIGENALFPHARAKNDLLEKSESVLKDSSMLHVATMAFNVPTNENGELACAVCHQEHRGSNFDIKKLNNMQCNACHINKINSFSLGHPEFINFPYKTRLNLKFDHVSHLKKHFQEEDKTVACVECHTTDTEGKMMVTKSYQESCSSCHSEQIRGEERSGEKGVLVFTLPGIDIVTLQQKNMYIGHWQEDAEGEITPFMELLLSADEDYFSIKDDLVDIDLLDLVDADNKTLLIATQFIWTVKKLYVDIALRGQAAIKERLELSLERELKITELTQLSAMFTAEFMDSSLKAWLPMIYVEMMLSEDIDKQMNIEILVENEQVAEFIDVNSVEPDERVISGGWYKSNDDFSIYYRPVGHADNFMQGWLNTTVQKKPEIVNAVFDLLSDKKSPGVCIKCHSVTEQDGLRSINWQAKRPRNFERSVVDFRHAPHFSVVEGDSCLGCHKLDIEADFLASYDNENPSEFMPSFITMKRETCAQCHVPEVAGDTCLSCHSYHIGVFEPTKNAKADK